MMEKPALAGEGGSARPPPVTLVSITYNVAVYTPAERADTLIHSPYFYSIPLCKLWFYQLIFNKLEKRKNGK
jgi:hypothetical protein